MKKIVLLILVILIITGCATSKDNASRKDNSLNKAKVNFAIFPVKEELTKTSKGRIKDIELESQPIITEKDIKSFKWDEQTFTLENSSIKKIPNNVPLNGKRFVVVAVDQRIYMGAFWTPASSIPTELPVILIPLNNGGLVSIQRGYPILYNTSKKNPILYNTGKKSDPRKDNRIYEVFKELDKLE